MDRQIISDFISSNAIKSYLPFRILPVIHLTEISAFFYRHRKM